MATLVDAQFLCRQEERVETDYYEYGLVPSHIIHMSYIVDPFLCPSSAQHYKTKRINGTLINVPFNQMCRQSISGILPHALIAQDYIGLLSSDQIFLRHATCHKNNFIHGFLFRAMMLNVPDEETVDLCRQASEVLPFWPVPDYIQGKALMDLNRQEEAKVVFQESLRKALDVNVPLHIRRAQEALQIFSPPPPPPPTRQEMEETIATLRQQLLSSEDRMQEMERKFQEFQQEHTKLHQAFQKQQQEQQQEPSTKGKRIRHVSPIHNPFAAAASSSYHKEQPSFDEEIETLKARLARL